jgi:hypothetical protein
LQVKTHQHLPQHRSNLAPSGNLPTALTGQQSPPPYGVILTLTEDAGRRYRRSFCKGTFKDGLRRRREYGAGQPQHGEENPQNAQNPVAVSESNGCDRKDARDIDDEQDRQQ